MTLFDLFNRQIDPAFWGANVVDSVTRQFQQWLCGKIAFDGSTFKDSEWTLTHRWLREAGIATIRLRFLDDNTYEQEVAEVASDGSLTPESCAVMKRKRATP